MIGYGSTRRNLNTHSFTASGNLHPAPTSTVRSTLDLFDFCLNLQIHHISSYSMDSLLAEINAKKRQLRDGSDEAESSSSAKKYKTRGEIEAEAEEEQRKKRADEADRRERLKAESRGRQMRKEVSTETLSLLELG